MGFLNGWSLTGVDLCTNASPDLQTAGKKGLSTGILSLPILIHFYDDSSRILDTGNEMILPSIKILSFLVKTMFQHTKPSTYIRTYIHT